MKESSLPSLHHCGTTRDSNLFTSLQGGRVIVFCSCSKKIALHVHQAITHQQNVSRSVSLPIQRQNSWFLASFTGSCLRCSQSPVKEKYHSNMKGHKRNLHFQLSLKIVPVMYYLIRESCLLSWVYTQPPWCRQMCCLSTLTVRTFPFLTVTNTKILDAVR